MYIYDKGSNNSIDIYRLDPKVEELRDFRKKILDNYKSEDLFYYLRTNSRSTVRKFKNAKAMNYNHLHYDYSDGLDSKPWSDFYHMEESTSHKDILDKYIEGYYDNEHTVRVYGPYRPEIFRLLITEEESVQKCSSGRIYQIDNIINLPRRLYLLHLLFHGRFQELADEDIEKQLQLFDINYLKSIKTSDINEIVALGLVNDSIDSVNEKIMYSSKVLKKAKNY